MQASPIFNCCTCKEDSLPTEVLWNGTFLSNFGNPDCPTSHNKTTETVLQPACFFRPTFHPTQPEHKRLAQRQWGAQSAQGGVAGVRKWPGAPHTLRLLKKL
jgi:hypothetical protein